MTPSRILNERNGFLGLTHFDCILILLSTLQLHEYLLPYHQEWIAFLFAPAIGIGLMSIRIKYRRRIIRDTVQFFLRERVIAEPRFKASGSRFWTKVKKGITSAFSH